MPGPDRLISQAELLKLIPFSKMTIWRYEKDGKFPKRIKLGPQRTAWSQREIEEWIEEKKQARNPKTTDPIEFF